MAGEDLIKAARAGSRDAFRRLVEEHQGAVRSFLMRTLGNAADADDLAQETFLAAWSSLWLYQGRSSVKTWLCGIAWKKALTHLRSRGREARRLDQLEGPGPVRETHDERLDAQAALAGLPAEQRAAVALCLGADFSHAEAAEALKLPLGTIKSHVQRGRLKMLAAFGGSDE
ncbi:MAG: RNA polymerase sigma factor [Caulobacteraceae bacterium]